jgi:hypothetical protein
MLRDPESRRDYDIVRERHVGATFRPRASTYTDPATPPKPPEPHVPMRPPPAWLASKVRVHMDSVMLTLQTPPPSPVATRVCNALACAALGGGLAVSSLELGALAIILWAIGRLLYVPPYGGTLAWAKIVPGRQQAEFHALDQRHQRYRRQDVPFHYLRVALVESRDDFRIEIQGFPRASPPVLLRTRDLDEAKRCAREAGRWFALPLARAA